MKLREVKSLSELNYHRPLDDTLFTSKIYGGAFKIVYYSEDTNTISTFPFQGLNYVSLFNDIIKTTVLADCVILKPYFISSLLNKNVLLA